MSKWPGKYVIGLTGNIGTGKSVVRRMLEHLGAYGIDADQLAHRAIAKGAPGYQPAIETFGKWILGPDGQIDRSKLGKMTFNDPSAMADLEKIIHPLVESAVDMIAKRSSQRVLVIEAIKLLESNLAKSCDSVWVSYAFPEQQLTRLLQQRHMDEAEARQRIAAQSPQEDKISSATVVIKNIASFDDTWRQVVSAWKKYIPRTATAPLPPTVPATTVSVPQGEISVMRGRPTHCKEIANLFNRLGSDGRKYTEEDIMAAFGEKAFLLLSLGEAIVGMVGWQVENLISRTTEVLLDPAIPQDKALPLLIKEMENASKDLQCEASLVFIKPELAKQEALWHNLGYERRTPQTLGVLAWQEAAIESMPPSTALLFKQLRIDRVLRPI